MSRLVLASLLAAVLVACGGKSSSPQPVAPLPPDEPVAKEPAEPVEKEVAPEPAPPPEPITINVPAEQVTIKLLKAGKGKKAALGYKLVAGTKQAFDTRLAVSSGGAQAMVLPTMLLGYAGEVVEVTDDGTARIRVVLESIGFEDTPGQTIATTDLEPMFASIKGLVAEYTVSPQGVVGDQKVTFPAGAQPDASMTQQLLPGVVALPAEAIGSGATWEVSRSKMGNFDAEVKTVYTLKARKGDAATVAGKTTIKGGAQQIEEGGVAIQVKTITGSGTATLDLTTAGLVATGTLTQDVAIAMQVNEQAFETKSSTKMTTATRAVETAKP
jgi:hypothetical protein